MKCPNCGKEALFVNGKYVCVDCGIEITPEQQAIQNQAADPMVGPAPTTDISEEAPQTSVEPVEEESPVVNVEPDPIITPELPEAVTSEAPVDSAKPVQDYFENAIATEEPLTPEAKSGVYDFTNNEASPVEASAEPETIVEPEVAPLSGATPEMAVEAPSYFTPNTFDPNTVQSEVPSVEPAVTQPEPEVTEPTQVEPAMPEAVIETPALGQDNPSPITEAVPQMETETKTLDDMLGGSPAGAPAANDTISAYGPTVDGMQQPTAPTPEPTLTNVTNETTMPSVESVFGTNPPASPTNEMPTAQDFGIAPPAPPQKKKIWPIVAIAVGALVLIGGIVAALVLSSNKTAAPVELDNAGIVGLSNSIAAAMQPAQGIAVDYNIRAQHTMNVTDETKAGDVYEEYFAVPYDQTAKWTTDTEGNITLESTAGTVKDKRTYVSAESNTYVYSEKDKKYLKKEGLQLSSIPAVFGVEAKAATFYTTNIDKATKVGTEMLGGATYNKYEIVPNAELVSSTLASMGSVFNGVTYESIDTSNIRLTAWLFPDGKIKKLALSGEVSVVTDKFNGKIALTGEANYSYETVTIINPGAPPAEAPVIQEAPKIEEPQATNNTEEGQPSSVDTVKIPTKTEPDPLVEVKG